MSKFLSVSFHESCSLSLFGVFSLFRRRSSIAACVVVMSGSAMNSQTKTSDPRSVSERTDTVSANIQATSSTTQARPSKSEPRLSQQTSSRAPIEVIEISSDSESESRQERRRGESVQKSPSPSQVEARVHLPREGVVPTGANRQTQEGDSEEKPG